jgi:hypothetical protein
MCGFRGFCQATQWRRQPWKRSIINGWLSRPIWIFYVISDSAAPHPIYTPLAVVSRTRKTRINHCNDSANSRCESYVHYLAPRLRRAFPLPPWQRVRRTCRESAARPWPFSSWPTELHKRHRVFGELGTLPKIREDCFGTASANGFRIFLLYVSVGGSF